MIPIASYWRLLRTYLAPFRLRVVGLSVVLITTIGLQVANPQIIKIFIDRAAAGEPVSALMPIALLFIGIATFHQALSVISTWVAEHIGWSATNALRRDLVDHLLHLDMGFHKQHSPGELVERVDGDVTALSNFFSQFSIHVVGNMALLIGVIALVIRENLWIGLGMIVFTLASLGVMTKMQRIASAWWAAVKAHRAEFFGFVGEVVGGTEDIRANGGAAYMERRFRGILGRWLPDEVRGRHGWSILWGTNIVMYALGNVLVFWLGSLFLGRGTLSLGSVYLIFHYTEMLRHPLDRIRTQMEDMQKAGAGVARIRDLLATTSRLVTVGEELLPDGPLEVVLDRVNFSYGDEDDEDNQRVLHDLTLRIAPGHVVGVLGRTGSGKTTLARLLTRLYDPDNGSVVIGGVNALDADVHELRRKVGMVTQDVQLFRATIRDNITFFDPAISDERIGAALEDLGISEWILGLPDGLDTMLDAGGGGLSAGEAQLLAFTRIFLEDPGLVILDEASSRLDPATEALIEKAVDRLLARRTGVVIAHRLDTVNRADDILILEDGRVVECASRLDLVADENSRFSQLLAVGMEEVLR